MSWNKGNNCNNMHGATIKKASYHHSAPAGNERHELYSNGVEQGSSNYSEKKNLPSCIRQNTNGVAWN